MYRLIIDRVVVNDYVNAIAPIAEVNPESLRPILYHLLRQHSRPLESSISEDSVLPVRMLVTVRTDRSNEVLVPDNGLFYTDCTASYPNKHPVDDTVMLSAKALVDQLFDCGDNTPIIIQRTTVYPIGACVYDDQVYVYINVVIDHTLKCDPTFKIRGCHFKGITSLSYSSPLEEELLKHLTLVKGGNEDV